MVRGKWRDATYCSKRRINQKRIKCICCGWTDKQMDGWMSEGRERRRKKKKRSNEIETREMYGERGIDPQRSRGQKHGERIWGKVLVPPATPISPSRESPPESSNFVSCSSDAASYVDTAFCFLIRIFVKDRCCTYVFIYGNLDRWSQTVVLCFRDHCVEHFIYLGNTKGRFPHLVTILTVMVV